MTSDFLSNLAMQALGAVPELRPLLPPRFAPWPAGFRTGALERSPQVDRFSPPLIDPDTPAVSAPLPTFRQMKGLQTDQAPVILNAPEMPASETVGIPETTNRFEIFTLESKRSGPSQSADPPNHMPPSALPPTGVREPAYHDAGSEVIASTDDLVVSGNRALPPSLIPEPTAVQKISPQAAAGQERFTTSGLPGPPAGEGDLQRSPQTEASPGQHAPVEAPTAPASRRSEPIVGGATLATPRLEPVARQPDLKESRAEPDEPRLAVIARQPGPIKERVEDRAWSVKDNIESVKLPSALTAEQAGPAEGFVAAVKPRVEHYATLPTPTARPPEHEDHVKADNLGPSPATGQSDRVEVLTSAAKYPSELVEGQVGPAERLPESIDRQPALVASRGELITPQPESFAREPKPIDEQHWPVKASDRPIEARPAAIAVPHEPAAHQPEFEDRAKPAGPKLESITLEPARLPPAPITQPPNQVEGRIEPTEERPALRVTPPASVKRESVLVVQQREPVEGRAEPLEAHRADLPVQPPTRVYAPTSPIIQPVSPLPVNVVQRQAVAADSPVVYPEPKSVPASGLDLPVSIQTGTLHSTAVPMPAANSIEPAPPIRGAVPIWGEPAITPPSEPLLEPTLIKTMRSTARDEDEQFVRPNLPPPRERLSPNEPEPIPTVHVTIGRVVVRASPTAGPPPSKPVELPRPPLSLDEYLKGRQGGER